MSQGRRMAGRGDEGEDSSTNVSATKAFPVSCIRAPTSQRQVRRPRSCKGTRCAPLSSPRSQADPRSSKGQATEQPSRQVGPAVAVLMPLARIRGSLEISGWSSHFHREHLGQRNTIQMENHRRTRKKCPQRCPRPRFSSVGLQPSARWQVTHSAPREGRHLYPPR